MYLTGVVPLKLTKASFTNRFSVQVERQKKIVNISFWQICSVKHVNRLKSTISLLLSVDKYMRLQMYKHCWVTWKSWTQKNNLLADARFNGLMSMEAAFIRMGRPAWGPGHALMSWQHIGSNPNLRGMHWPQHASQPNMFDWDTRIYLYMCHALVSMEDLKKRKE